MNMEVLSFVDLKLPQVLQAAKAFKTSGELTVSARNLVYVDIDDNYVHQLFPLLKKHYPKIEKPDYFGVEPIGAHISVVYPEENTLISEEDFGQHYDFKINGVFLAVMNHKKYYVLGVESPLLLALRHRYGLLDKLSFKHHLIDFHVTVATEALI